MGGPSADSVADPISPVIALTLAEIIARGWKLRSQCDTCSLVLALNPEALIRAHGPHVLLWGQRPRCTKVHDGRWRCEGRVALYAQSVSGASWGRLRAVTASEREAVKVRNDAYARRYVKDRETPAER